MWPRDMSVSSQGHVPGFEGTAPNVHTHMAHCLQNLCTAADQRFGVTATVWGYDRSSTILFTYQYFYD